MKYAISCKTEEEAKKLMNFLNLKGFKWISGMNLMNYTNWNVYKENTCYRLDYYDFEKVVSFGIITHYITKKYEIIEPMHFMNDYQKYTNGFFGE